MWRIKVPASPFCHSLSKGIHVKVIKRSRLQILGVKKPCLRLNYILERFQGKGTMCYPQIFPISLTVVERKLCQEFQFYQVDKFLPENFFSGNEVYPIL